MSRTSEPEDLPRVRGYEVTGRLGYGGMGTVWRAVQLSTRRPVALKLLGAGLFPSPQARRRFDREVELTARLEHPHVARVYDSGRDHGVWFYAMELVEGVPLDRHVADHKLDRGQILKLARVVCEAVQYAHQRGVIHRDLKPGNILVTPDGRPKVLDFGLAKTLLREEQGEGENLALSVDGEVAGTPAYMSPEQAAGRPVDTRTDVYSLGVILYRLLVGRSPHDLSGSSVEVIRRIAEQEVVRPRKGNPEMDKELETLLLKALERDPDRRYASAGDLARDIGNYLGGEPLAAKPPTTGYFLRKRLSKYRGRVIAAGVALAVLVAFAVSAAVSIIRARNEANPARAGRRRKRPAWPNCGRPTAWSRRRTPGG